MQATVQILPWNPAFKDAFYALNRAWIEVDYPLEPIDIAVLSDPEHYILAGGGVILSAVADEEVIGVVGLRPAGDDLELTKMAVDLAWRGRGIGLLLMNAALAEALRLGINRVILYSNTHTSGPAVQLYRKVGFVEIPLEQGVYKRANIKMQFSHALGQ